MKTKHYIVNNIAEFSEQTEEMKKLAEYLDYIESVFPVIEEVFGEAWNDGQINIELDESMSGASYVRRGNLHIIKMKISNSNIQKKYPENLWGCLFHETHHAFFNPIIYNKRPGRIFNEGHEGEAFNFAFMATTYLKLKEKNKIDAQVYERFLKKLKGELPDDVNDLFQEYVSIFSMNTKNFAKFIFYLKSSDSVFTDLSNFRQDLDEAKRFLAN